MSKRLVLLSEGLHTIFGFSEDNNVPVILHLPTAINEEGEVTATLPISLIKVKPRFALYKEMIAPQVAGKFNDTFDPRQV